MISEAEPILLQSPGMTVTILPKTGKIISLYDKVKHKEWLWTCTPAQVTGDSFDARWSGGLDLLFPCDEEAVGQAEFYRDHGICWRDCWSLQAVEAAKVILGMDAYGFRLSYTMAAEGRSLSLSVRIHNRREDSVLYLLRWHPAFALETLQEVSYTDKDGMCENLLAHPANSRQAYTMEYLEPSQGKIFIEDKQGRYLQMHYDIERLPALTVFASNGGWMGHKIIVPEPSTGKYSSLEEIRRENQGRYIEPGETQEYTLVLQL